MKFQITFLGANSLFGRVASALLSRTPAVRTLKLYDEVDIPRLHPNGKPTCEVLWHMGKEELAVALEDEVKGKNQEVLTDRSWGVATAHIHPIPLPEGASNTGVSLSLQGSDIVVIGDDSKVIATNEKDALISTASKVVDFVYAVAQTAPKAMVVVAASPLNLMVPLAGYVLKEVGCYDGRKLLGVTSVDTLRANAIYSDYIAQPNSILPVVGGASPQTRVPIFSHARPALDLPEEDMHRLIDKIKSFDLNMEGSALKESTLERAYATVRLVNSLLSGLQEEPCTQEMALAKTSLIPEVNYFSLPVDLGKFGIERTFGLPQLSQLETEMIDYAIINLNNDLIKAQDLYASFKPCFEMLQSIVGGSRRCNNEMNETCSQLIDQKIVTRKKKEQKEKSNKRKRSEQIIRNRKRARANRFPIIHCPAPEVVTDIPIEENFGKIERVHKKLQVNQIFQERIVDGLPRLNCNEGSDLEQPKIQSDITDSSSQMADPTNQNITSLSDILSSMAAPNTQRPISSSGKQNIANLADAQNNTTVVDKSAKQNFKCGNKEETLGSKNIKENIDLKGRIKKKHQYDHLQPHVQNQYARMEMMKSLMQQKQNRYQKTKAMCRSNSSTSQNKIEYLKKKAMELKTSNVKQSSNNPISMKPKSTEKQKEASESNNDAVSVKESRGIFDIGEIPGSGKIEKLTMSSLENDSFDEQFSLLMDDIGEQCGTRKYEGEIKSGIENNGDQQMSITKEKINLLIANKESNKNSHVDKVVDLKNNREINKMHVEMKPKIEAVSEHNKKSLGNKVVDYNIHGKMNEMKSEMEPNTGVEAVTEYNKNSLPNKDGDLKNNSERNEMTPKTEAFSTHNKKSLGNKLVDLNINRKINEMKSEMEPNTGMETVTQYNKNSRVDKVIDLNNNSDRNEMTPKIEALSTHNKKSLGNKIVNSNINRKINEMNSKMEQSTGIEAVSEYNKKSLVNNVVDLKNNSEINEMQREMTPKTEAFSTHNKKSLGNKLVDLNINRKINEMKSEMEPNTGMEAITQCNKNSRVDKVIDLNNNSDRNEMTPKIEALSTHNKKSLGNKIVNSNINRTINEMNSKMEQSTGIEAVSEYNKKSLVNNVVDLKNNSEINEMQCEMKPKIEAVSEHNKNSLGNKVVDYNIDRKINEMNSEIEPNRGMEAVTQYNKNSRVDKVIDLKNNSERNEMTAKTEAVSEHDKNLLGNKFVDYNINRKINEMNSAVEPNRGMEAVSEYNKKSLANNVVDFYVNRKINEMNSEMEPNTGMEAVTKNISVEKQKNTSESCSLNEKSLKAEKNNNPKKISCEEVQSTTLLESADNNFSEVNEIEIIPEDKIAAIEDKKEKINEKSDCIGSNASLEKGIYEETSFQNKSKAKITRETEKSCIKAMVYDVTKESNDGKLSETNIKSTDYNKSANEIIEQKCSSPRGQTLDVGNPVTEIDAQEKLEELEYLSKRQKRDELKEKDQKTTPKTSYDPLEQVNKIREITMRKIKEPLKYPNLSKTEKNEEIKNALKMENIKDIKETKTCLLEDEDPESIEVFNYEPKNMHDTKNITNINEMIKSLVKPNDPKAKSEPTRATQISTNTRKGDVPIVDSKSTRVKVMNLKKDAAKIIMKNQLHSKDAKLKKDDQRASSSIKSDLNKTTKQIPFPFLKNIKGKPKDETFDKHKWLKQKTHSVAKEDSPTKLNLKTIDESNAVTIHSRNINESFTKRIQKNKCSNKITDSTKTVSYAINTKNKKDELSKRYTVLKKGQLCYMVKDDINADEIKAKLYKKTLMGGKTSIERSDKKNYDMTGTKNISFTDLSNYPPKNIEISDSTPLPNVLETEQKMSLDIRNDANNNNHKNSNKTNNNNNNNAIALKNKSFLNMVANSISKRSPTLNETAEAIGVRGSHYGSGTFSKNPTSDELKIQLLTKKAKDQLNITKFKNNKRISPGLSGGLPVVSYELGETRQPVTAMEQEDNAVSNKYSATDSMVRTKNKIQLMKDKYQRLKNTNLYLRNVNATSPSSGVNLIKSKESNKNVYGAKSSLGESLKKSSKSNPEPKYEKVVKKNNEIGPKSGDMPFNKLPVKEITTTAPVKPKSESEDQISVEKGNSLTDSKDNRKLDINCSEVYNKNQPPETGELKLPEAKVSETIQNSVPSGDKNMTVAVEHKICPSENQQGSQDKNKSVNENFDKEQEMPKSIEEEKVITAPSNMKPSTDEKNSKVNKLSKSSNANVNKSDLKKKVSNDRTHAICNLKHKEKNKESNDISRPKESTNTAAKEKYQQSKFNALTKIKLPTKKPKPVNETAQNAALKAVFSSRPTAGDLIKMKQERKTPETDTAKSRPHKIPPLNFGVRAVVENNLIPRNSTASSLLLDPDIERRPSTTRKVIHPSLMHAVKPFSGQNTDLTKLKTNFYSRWTPQNLKMKSNKEDDALKSKNERIQKNPFVSGKINLTSDVFKAYMKQNRNYEFANSNGDVQFLHQCGQLVSIPQQGVSGNTSRINDQRVAFSTLEANSERTRIPKNETATTQIAVSNFRFHNEKPSLREKPNIPPSSLFNKPMRINKNHEGMATKESQVKGKNALLSSYKSPPPVVPRGKPVLNKSQTTGHTFDPFRCREKELALKKMHLLKAFQIQENNNQKFEELQRNYKQQFRTNSANAFNNQQREVSKKTANRLNMLNRPSSAESMKKVPSVEIRQNKKPFSAPANYHPSFPLSKPKKREKNKKDESGNTLKKRWTQLLDIFQSVITTEKKNWEQESPDKNVLGAGTPHMVNNALVPKSKINLRGETSNNSNSTTRIVQSYYRRHSGGGPKFQSSYSLSNRTNKP